MVSRSLGTTTAVDTSGIDESSMDELALSKIGGQSPLAPRSTNTKLRKVNLGATPKLQASPKKTLYLETPGPQGGSPLRVKVTMQAEQVDDQDEPGSPSKRGRPKSKVVKIPLKDADEPVKRKPGRPRKSDVEPSAVQKRKATPIRRQSKRLSGSSEVQDDFRDQPPAKKRGRPSKSASQAEQADPGMGTKSPKKVGRPKKLSQPETSRELPSPDNQVEDESRTVPSGDPGFDVVDAGSMKGQQADGDDDILPSDPKILESPTGSSEEIMPMSDTPSVGQSPQYYSDRRKSKAYRSPTGPRRPGLSRLRNEIETNTARQHSQESSRNTSLRQLSAKAQTDPTSTRAPQFDFTKLTPLHEKHTITPVEPIQPHMPARSTPRPKAGDPILNRRMKDEPQQSEPLLRRHLFLQQSQYPENALDPVSTRTSRFREPTPVPTEFGEGQHSEQRSIASMEAPSDERNQDEEMWRRMIPDRDDDHSTGEEATPASDSGSSDYGGLDEMTGRPIGDNTLMQSEEFSMVSLDSLESVRDQNSSFVGGNQTGSGGLAMIEPQRTAGASSNIIQHPTSLKHPSKLKQAWFPESSPGAHLSPNVSVQRGRHSSRPQSSPYPHESPSQGSKSRSQHQSRKDVSEGLESRPSLSGLESSSVGAAPISSFLQSNVEQRLGNGFSLQDRINSNDDSLNRPPLATHSANSRLPTPNSADKESQNTSSSRLETRPDSAGQQLQRSADLESDRIPTKSDSVTSMQSHTPSATERGSSPILDDATDLNHNTTFQELPSSPPARIERSGGLEESRAWLRTQNAMEQTWRKAKQQLSPPSKPQTRSIIISDDESYSDDSEDDEEVENAKTIQVEDEIEDVWQEEASRGSNIDVSNPSNGSRNGTGSIKRRLFSAEEEPRAARSTKVPRTSKPFNGSPEQDDLLENERPQPSRAAKISSADNGEQDSRVGSHDKVRSSQTAKMSRTFKPPSAAPRQVSLAGSKRQPADPEHERQKKVSSTIDDMFKNIAGSSANRELQDDPGSTRPVDRMFPPSGEHNREGANEVQQRMSTYGSSGDSSLSTKPIRHSQLGNQLSPETDISHAKQTDSFVSVASDVQQLRNEMKSSHNLPSTERRPTLQAKSKQVHSTRTTTQRIPVNLGSVDDSIRSNSGGYDSSSLLSLNPNKQTATPLFQSPQETSTKLANINDGPPMSSTQAKVVTQTSTVQETEQVRVREKSTTAAPLVRPKSGILTRLKTHLPFLNPGSADISINGPSRPKHPLLSNLPFLPMAFPFTKTHYIVLEELWKRYKAAPELFLTSRPENAGLMTKSLNKWSDATLSEWGYDCILKPSSLILVALYCRLLVLKDAREFRNVEGRDLEMGESGKLWIEQREREKAEGKSKWRLDQLIIGEAYVTVRLFSLMVCEIVREDEARGVEIDRELRFKWKAKGERGWNFSFLVDE
ncbi:hypothetical protein FKW77_010671 [Venturia effusa]|uniref:Uncharacterized protein n=1 Tax=Venturia effusa TaxID=50376 RepID=A0A517KY50_9PEZI|nr:hypothetical protein FKW77_010671 [Venturia effusa]